MLAGVALLVGAAVGYFYLFTVKDNQPTLLADLKLGFQRRGEPDFRKQDTLAHSRQDKPRHLDLECTEPTTSSTGTATRTAAAYAPATGRKTPPGYAASPIEFPIFNGDR